MSEKVFIAEAVAQDWSVVAGNYRDALAQVLHTFKLSANEIMSLVDNWKVITATGYKFTIRKGDR